MDTATKLYTHDCDGCTFLGTHQNADLYHCDQGVGFPTVIARLSSDGPDYLSGLVFADRIPSLGEAKARAIALGLNVKAL